MLRSSNALKTLLLFLVFVSCHPNRIYNVRKGMPNQWNKNDIVRFKIDPPDTKTPCNLFVDITNTNAYKYNNLYLIVSMVFPQGKTLKDTLQYRMADPTGKFLGTGWREKDNALWYKKNVVFKEKGEYLITIRHAMREGGHPKGIVNLKGITSVGLRIETAK